MVKCETIGMLDIAKINPVLVSETDVTNHSFMTVDDVLYLIDNTTTGDEAYKEGVVYKAGEKLNGYIVKAWEGQKLVVDGKHIVDGVSSLNVGDVLVANSDGKLETGTASGTYFVVAEKTYLTEAAVKVVVTVAATE